MSSVQSGKARDSVAKARIRVSTFLRGTSRDTARIDLRLRSAPGVAIVAGGAMVFGTILIRSCRLSCSEARNGSTSR